MPRTSNVIRKREIESFMSVAAPATYIQDGKPKYIAYEELEATENGI